MKHFTMLSATALLVPIMASPLAGSYGSSGYDSGYGGGGSGGDGGGGSDSGSSGQTAGCVNNQVVSCCNTGASVQHIGGGVAGILSAILAPGSCSPLSLPIVGAELQQFCGNNVASCCENNQVGLINVNIAQCVPIAL